MGCLSQKPHQPMGDYKNNQLVRIYGLISDLLYLEWSDIR